MTKTVSVKTARRLQALLSNGLKMVTPDTAQLNEWRAIVNASHRQMASEGTFDVALLDQMQGLMKAYRNGTRLLTSDQLKTCPVSTGRGVWLKTPFW